MPSEAEQAINEQLAEVVADLKPRVRQAAETLASMLRQRIRRAPKTKGGGEPGKIARGISVRDASMGRYVRYIVSVPWPWMANEYGYRWIPHSQTAKQRYRLKRDRLGRLQRGGPYFIPPKPYVKQTVDIFRAIATDIIAGGNL